MAVPTLTDLTKLSPHTSGSGASASLSGGKYVCKSPAGGIARVFYLVDFDHSEEFTISGRFFFPKAPPGDGLTCPLRVENYVEGSNRPLNRLEIDRFKDGTWRLVRNRLVEDNDPTGEYETIAHLPMQLPVGVEFDLAMSAKLSTTTSGYTAIYLNGNQIVSFVGKNWSSPAMRVQRARFGIIQGGGGSSEVHVLAAALRAGLFSSTEPPPTFPPPKPPDPPDPPEPPPTDPCVAHKTYTAAVIKEMDRTDNPPRKKIANMKKFPRP